MIKFIKVNFKSIGDMKISNKMMFIYVMGGFIPLLLLAFYFTGFTRNIILDQATNEALNNAVRLEERLQEAFVTAVDVSDGIYLDAELKRLVKTQYTSTQAVIKDLTEFSTFDEYLRLYDEIDSIHIYVENATLLDNAQIIKTTDKHRRSNWYQTALAMDGRAAFVYRYDDIKLTEHIAMVRLIKDYQGFDIGVLVINIKNVALRKMLDSEPYEILGVLDKNRVFLSTKLEKAGVSLFENKEIERLLELEAVISDYSSHEGKFKVINKHFKAHSSNNEISLITLIPMERFLDQANRSIRNSIILIVISVVSALFMVYQLTRRLSDRIESFRTNMHKVATGDFDVEFDDEPDDEVGLLFEDLKLMSESLESLMEKVFQEGQFREQLTVRQKEVEFKMLTSQIDPHFLYNTLETIRMEAIIHDQYSIAEVVKKLAFIMRRKLSVSNDEVSLASELELLTHYLEIQKFRFGDRVAYKIQCDCDPTAYTILPLLLQPIVENAFIHGLEKNVGPGEIIIAIKVLADYLEITIADNGIGISKEMLEALKHKMAQDLVVSGESIGMMNVYQRVKIYYGDPYGLEIASEKDQGTRVTFTLPKKTIQPEE